MKELTQTEVMEVSGAGIVSDAGKVLGSGFGALIDAGASIFGIKPNASATIGKSAKASVLLLMRVFPELNNSLVYQHHSSNK